MSLLLRLLAFAGLTLLFQLSPAAGQDEFERPPISYRHTPAANDITLLQQRLERGETTLQYDDQFGYLTSLLDELQVPVDSQLLVFSKTSLQARRISPKTPRALYFNDEIYIGYCHAADKLEIAAIDPLIGTAFYTLSQAREETPRFLQQTDDCLTCHASSRTDGVPGLLARSLYVNAIGFPIFSGGNRNVDHTTPLSQRWGGWYVTGTHGSQTHQGNLLIRTQEVPRDVDNSQGMNVVDLKERFHVENYLEPSSDLVALMVHDHQILVHNRMVRANFTTRQALDYEVTMNRALNEPEDQRRESTTRRIQNVGDALIAALLFAKEAELTEPVCGVSGFVNRFSQRGPTDSQGRSLYQFDLQKRLFKYPCSFLVYSKTFDELPPALKEYLWQEMWAILAQGAKEEQYAHLSAADRRSIIEILRETKTDLPPCWHEELPPLQD